MANDDPVERLSEMANYAQVEGPEAAVEPIQKRDLKPMAGAQMGDGAMVANAVRPVVLVLVEVVVVDTVESLVVNMVEGLVLVDTVENLVAVVVMDTAESLVVAVVVGKAASSVVEAPNIVAKLVETKRDMSSAAIAEDRALVPRFAVRGCG